MIKLIKLIIKKINIEKNKFGKKIENIILSVLCSTSTSITSLALLKTGFAMMLISSTNKPRDGY